MWRDTSRLITVLGVNAGVVLPVFLFLLRMRWWTFYLMLACSLFFAFLHWKGWTIMGAGRRFRCWLTGKRRPGVPAHKKRGYA